MPTLAQDIDSARDHFVAWVRWYLAVYKDVTPSAAELAKKLDVSGSAVSQLIRKGSRRRPSFEVLIAFKRLLDQVMVVPMDAILRSDPPDMRPYK